MVVLFIILGILAGGIAAGAAWLYGYGIELSACLFSLVGSSTVIASAVFRVLFVRLASWWWAKNVEFRFIAITAQTILFAGLGILAITIFLLISDAQSVFLTSGITLLLVAPLWLTFAFDYILGKPEPQRREDYL